MAISRTIVAALTAALALAVLAVNIWNLVIAADDHSATCDEHIRIYWDMTFAASAVAIVLSIGVLWQLYYVFRSLAYPLYITHWGVWSIIGWLYIMATAIVGEIFYNEYYVCSVGLMNDVRKSLDIIWFTFAAGVVIVLLNHLYAFTPLGVRRTTAAAPVSTAGVQPYGTTTAGAAPVNAGYIA